MSTTLAQPDKHIACSDAPRPTARVVADELFRYGLGPFLATPCGVLAPLLDLLGTNLIIVSREENAIGVAAGAALAGRTPVVLIQNSGLGASVNALASLVQPYAIPLILVVSLRGWAPDTTSENLLMGQMTQPVLNLLGIAYRTLDSTDASEQIAWAAQTATERHQTVALLVPPDLFNWTPK